MPYIIIIIIILINQHQRESSSDCDIQSITVFLKGKSSPELP